MVDTRKNHNPTAEFLTTRKGKALSTAGTTALILLGLRGARGLGRTYLPKQMEGLSKQLSKGRFHIAPGKAWKSKDIKNLVVKGKAPLSDSFKARIGPEVTKKLQNIDPLGGSSIASAVLVTGGIGALVAGLDRDNYAHTLAKKVNHGRKLSKTEKIIVGNIPAEKSVDMPKSWRGIGSKSGFFQNPAAVSALAGGINLGMGQGVGIAAKGAGDALVERFLAKNVIPRALASRAHSGKDLRASEKSLLSALKKAQGKTNA